MIVYRVVMNDYEQSMTDSVWKNKKDAEERAKFVQRLLNLQQKIWNLYWKVCSVQSHNETLEEMLALSHDILQEFAMDSWTIDGIHAVVEKSKVR